MKNAYIELTVFKTRF